MNRFIIPDVLSQHAEGVCALWVKRDRLVNAPRTRLRDIGKLDERIDAHLDGFLLAGPDGLQILLEALAVDVGAYFAAGFAFIQGGDLGGLTTMLRHAFAAEQSVSPGFNPWRGLVCALAWGKQPAVATIIPSLVLGRQPMLRNLAIAALGARRTNPGPTLASTLADPSPLVRARAYRTTGQLGRADLMAHLRPGLNDPDPECRFWSVWAAARMGAGEEALGVLAEIAWTNQPRAVRALDLLLRRLEVPHANAWLREFAKLPGRQRELIRATGVVGDPVYIPWLIQRMTEPETARLAGEAFSMITGLDLAYRDLDRRKPEGFESGPNDDPRDDNVALDEEDDLPWPDPVRIGNWWTAYRDRFASGTPYFLGQPKETADWLDALSDAFQRQRHAAALELAIRQPDKAMFEVRARGRLQRQLLARARGVS
jgi:uncharacterized protein (TIGR02270 family)